MFNSGDVVWFTDGNDGWIEGTISRRTNLWPGINMWAVIAGDKFYYVREEQLELTRRANG